MAIEPTRISQAFIRARALLCDKVASSSGFLHVVVVSSLFLVGGLDGIAVAFSSLQAAAKRIACCFGDDDA